MQIQWTGDFQKDYGQLAEYVQQWEPLVLGRQDNVSVAMRPVVEYFGAYPIPIQIPSGAVSNLGTLRTLGFWARIRYVFTGRLT